MQQMHSLEVYVCQMLAVTNAARFAHFHPFHLLHLPQFWVDLELAMCLQRLVLLQVRPTDLLVQIYLSDLFCLSFQPRHGFAATALLVLGGTLK